jgi:hypothetical protein
MLGIVNSAHVILEKDEGATEDSRFDVGEFSKRKRECHER